MNPTTGWRSLKTKFKAALRSGKIVYVGPKRQDGDILNFRVERYTSTEAWKNFESDEFRLRQSIASQKYVAGSFLCKGNIKLWLSIIKIIAGTFFKDGRFLHQNNDRCWPLPFTKYCLRVVKSLPTDIHSNVTEFNDVLQELESRLTFVKHTIQPYFSRKSSTPDDQLISKTKLVELWLNKRKKAIAIIKNDGKLPIDYTPQIPIERNETYYCGIQKYVIESQFNNNDNNERYFNPNDVHDEAELFTFDELKEIVMSCPNGKSSGCDGVKYEDLKSNWNVVGLKLVDVFNISLLNYKISSNWKHALINRTPKKDFNEADLSTLRDISLLPTVYKIFSKAICQRILPYVSERIPFWQRAYLQKRDRQELIFSLKTAIDDFKRLSTKFYVVFIDFADAFGSVKHAYIFETLQELGIPYSLLCIIEDVYRYSTFQVICKEGLSKKFFIVRGTKTGDPLSGLLFLLVVDRVCKPMVTTALIHANLRNEQRLNPIPVLCFADDLCLSSFKLEIMTAMTASAEPEMERSGLDVKARKCAVFYERRSGNNWYKGKNDSLPIVSVQDKILPVLKRNEPYKYLGKSVTIAGEDPGQITELMEKYTTLLDKIAVCNLPLSLKASALNNMALAKFLHHFDNTRLEVLKLKLLNNKLTDVVRSIFSLYKSTTQSVIYLPREIGGIGIKKISDVYYVTRISFLIKMLNHDVLDFKFVARESLKRDMVKRGVQLSNLPNNFLGYEVNNDGYVNSTTRFGGLSDWLELSRYARKVGVSLHFVEGDACILLDDKYHKGNIVKKVLYDHILAKRIAKAKTLNMQGKFLCMEGINNKLSNTILYNWNVDDDLVKFCVKARLNIIPTNFNIFIWNRLHDPKCSLCHHTTESTAHVLNGCHVLKNFYSARHNRIVDEVYKFVKPLKRRFRCHKDKFINTIITDINFAEITHRRPDIIVIDIVNKSCIIVEITVCYDLYFELACAEKKRRYTPLCDILSANGYDMKLIVLCFGSLGSVKKDVWSGLRYFKPAKESLKRLLKWCSISCIIGSNYTWRHRVKKVFGVQ